MCTQLQIQINLKMTNMLRSVTLSIIFFLCFAFLTYRVQISNKSLPLSSLETGGTKNELLLNSKVKSFCIWENDTKCDSFLTQFAMPGSLPTRALVSYPGSGNTWIR